ncbi:MAG: alpha/beta hydrolase [Myxococcales bacterium]|nr:alpha/beta hydrolase [Myxococcales bacterium]
MLGQAHEEHGMVVRRVGRASREGVLEIVWLHGLGERSSCFDAAVDLLPGFAHVLPDLPGYGDSQPPVLAEGDSLVATAEHLAGWLTSWPVRSAPILAGHSMGGVLATLVAERIPVRGVIDIDGNLTRGDCTFSAEAAGFSLPAFEEGGFDAMRARVVAEGERDAALGGYGAALATANPVVFHRNAVDLVRLSETATLAPRLAALTVPVLFVAGLPGGICAASQRALDEHHLPWVGLEPSGHWPFIDQVQMFASIVRAFARDL